MIILKNNCLNKTSVIKSNREFDFIIRNGKVIHSKFFVLTIVKDNQKQIGFTTNKGLKAVERNRLKRILRELWRKNNSQNSLPGKAIIIIRRNALNDRFSKIENDYTSLLGKAKAIYGF